MGLLSVFLSLAVISWWSVFRFCDKRVRVPYSVFALSYFVTTVIGATYVGLSDSKILWRLSDPTLDLQLINQTNNFQYWFLLYAPLFVPVLPVLIFSRLRFRGFLFPGVSGLFRDPIDCFSLLSAACAFSGYCIWTLVRNGYAENILTALRNSGDYQSLITTRTSMMDTLNADFYGILYVGLPTLSVIAFYQWLRARQSRWLVTFAFTGIILTLLTLSTIQKGPLFVYGLALFLCMVSVGAMRTWLLLLLCFSGLAIFSMLQTVFLGKWGFLETILLLVFRMAGSYPFYLNLYPEHIPYMGLNFGAGLLGWGVTLDDNLRVFDYMYPQILWVQGAAAAPAHVRAFALGGPLASVMVLMMIGTFISGIAHLNRTSQSPILFGAYIQLLICLYYLTQTSIRGAVLESYGFRYALLSLGFLWVVRKIVVAAVLNIRQAQPFERPS